MYSPVPVTLTALPPIKEDSFEQFSFDNFTFLGGNAAPQDIAKPIATRSSSSSSFGGEPFDMSLFMTDEVHALPTPALSDDLQWTSPFSSLESPAFDPLAFVSGSEAEMASLFPQLVSQSQLKNSYEGAFNAPVIASPVSAALALTEAGLLPTCSPLEVALSPKDSLSPPFEPLLAEPLLAEPSTEADQPYDEPKSKRKRKDGKFTGFRQSSVAPVAIDAPIQPRNYVLPSATSRKEVPALAKKLTKKRKKADVDEGDVLDADIVSAVEQKRLSNTLAARRSRQRKAEQLSTLSEELNAWKAKALLYEEMLKNAGLL